MRRSYIVLLASAYWVRAHLVVAAEPASTSLARQTANIVVVARPDPVSHRERAAASTVIRRAELQAPAATAADILDRVPGLQVQRSGAKSDFSTVSIRGATAAQLPVYLAGIRLNDDIGGAADLSTIPLWMLDRVEVFRGNAPSDADRLGMAGAVFFEPRLPRGPEAQAAQLWGSFGTRATQGGVGLGGAAGSLLLGLRVQGSDNAYRFSNDGGTRFDTEDDREERRHNAKTESFDLWGIGRYSLGPAAQLLVLANGFFRHQGVTGLSIVPARESHARLARSLLALSVRMPCSGIGHSERACELELSTSALGVRSRLTDPLRELSLGAKRVETRAERVQQRLSVRLRKGSGLRLRLQAAQSFERQALSRSPVSASLFASRARRSSTRVALSATLPWAQERWTLSGLISVNVHCTALDADSRCRSQPVGRLSLVHWLNESVEIVSNWARSVRVPTLGELYSVAPLVRGNVDLQPERGWSWDLGVRAQQNFGQLRASLETFAYARTVDKLVIYRRSLRQLVPFNVGRARLLGVEAQFGLRWRGLGSDWVLSLLDARDHTQPAGRGKPLLPLRSRLTASWGLWLSPLRQLLGSQRLRLGTWLMHRSSRYQDPAGLIVIPQQFTLNLQATVALLQERLQLRARAENVAHAERFDVVGLPLPGRAFYFSMEGRL